MLLQRLIEYADRLEPQPLHYAKKPVHWVAEIDAQGQWLGTGFVPLDKGYQRVVPYIERSGTGLQPILFFDKPEYALGVAIGKEHTSDHEKAVRKHWAFRQSIEECATQTDDPDVRAIAMALGRTDRPAVPSSMKPSHWILFRVDGRFPTDSQIVQHYWAMRQARETHGGDYQCIGCGERCAPTDRHRIPIPLRGGQGSGTKLISANDPAYGSYGLSESLIAPTCTECARKYATALCSLLDSPNHHFVTGKLTYIFWTRVSSNTNLLLLQQPDPDAIRALLESPARGRQHSTVDENRFYAVALSPNVSRIVVRDWMETTVSQVHARLVTWFRKQQLTGVDQYQSLFSLASSLYPSQTKNMANEIQSSVTTHLLKHALYGHPLPFSLLLQALRRCEAEPAKKKFTAARLALLKLYLLQTPKFKEDDLVALEDQRKDAGYVCGRLLAELEHIQSLAIGHLNVSLVDRYYGAASAAPSAGFPYLLKIARYHLAKIRREKRGLASVLLGELEGIMSLLDDFPRQLLPEEQALFAIGYYHQRQHIQDAITHGKKKNEEAK